MPKPKHHPSSAAPPAAALARACAQRMLRGDRISRAFGVELVDAAAGRAALTMAIREDMLNAFGTCHGGVLFTLADTALSCACNSHNERSVAHHCSVIYLRPGNPGERLTATAIERSKVGRVGIYDVSVKDSRGAIVAEFLGHARTIGGPVIDSDETGGSGLESEAAPGTLVVSARRDPT
jgi:acyl-CoA thioesterase